MRPDFCTQLDLLSSEAIDGEPLLELSDDELQGVIDAADEISYRAIKERDRRKK